MPNRILIVDGHPDPDDGRLCHALSEAYRRGAEASGREVRQIAVARLDFPLLRTAKDVEAEDLPPEIAAAQADILWADHLVIVYPLWLGTLPALLKGFLEQTLRDGFAFDVEKGLRGAKLQGRSARVVVTMGMPALAYRLFYRAHSLKSLERNILKFCGFSPIRTTLFGGATAPAESTAKDWMAEMERLGRAGG